jgi:hypothetical protein
VIQSAAAIAYPSTYWLIQVDTAINASLTLNGDAINNADLTVTGTINGGSNTIPCITNMMDFKSGRIGCSCETTGETADVYDHPIDLDSPNEN